MEGKYVAATIIKSTSEPDKASPPRRRSSGDLGEKSPAGCEELALFKVLPVLNSFLEKKKPLFRAASLKTPQKTNPLFPTTEDQECRSAQTSQRERSRLRNVVDVEAGPTVIDRC